MVKVTEQYLNSKKIEDRYKQQSKRISQLIAFVWLKLEHSKTAKELDKYFKNSKVGDKDYKLKDLLYADPNSEDLEEQERFKLMQEVFKNTSSPLEKPLFDKADERDEYEFTIDIEQFRTELIDPRIGEEKYVAVMAYPPRPPIADNGQLTAKELEDWINDDSTDVSSGKVAAPNPFIPLCCS